MKLRHTIILAISATLLAACNFTLAADVTPPPGYIPPTPAPTLGPLYPASAPDIENGKLIYAEKCAPCHGNTGLGDGTDGKQLPVTVAAFALPETAHKASPAKWYTVVTQGNLDRFMPPFASLNDQQRWDVISYALTLHTTPEQIETGRSLLEQNCADCAKNFGNQERMSSLSADDIVKMIKAGAGDLPAFGSGFSDEEAYAVAAYIRTLSYAPPAAPAADSAAETLVAAEAETPSAQTTPVDGEQAQVTTPEATAEPLVASLGKISGLIENHSGTDFPSDLKITLRGYDHGSDPSAGPQEILNLEGTVNADGTYVFETGIVEKQIYLAEFEMGGLNYQSGYAVASAGTTGLVLPTIVVHATTEDFSALRIDSVQIFFDFANADITQIFAVYSITNASDKTIIINMGDKQVVPFIASPDGAEGLGYEDTQNSAPFLQTANVLAMPPSETPYELIAFASLPKTKEIAISQPARLPIGSISLYLPEGMDAEGKTLTDEGLQALKSMNFHVYSASGLKKDESIDFTITGKPETTAVNPDITQNKTLLISAGALGVALILAGLWLYMRDRKKEQEFEDEEQEFEDTESIMDAIIALDDLHRVGTLTDQAYQQRREELKNALKRKS